jgi:hypothetical protein
MPEIGLLEQRPDIGAGHLLAGAVGHFLDDLAELDLQRRGRSSP